MIRPATPDDVPAIARAHARSWHRAYAEIIAPEALDHIDEEMLIERWTGLVADPEYHAWVWDQGGTIAGVVAVDGDALRNMYVDPVAQGAGVGTALLAAAVGAGARTLRTFAGNGAARAFYEHHGWALEGEEEPWMGEPVVGYRRLA